VRFILLLFATLPLVACSTHHAEPDQADAGPPPASCPSQPTAVEGQPCTDADDSCALCPENVRCCRQILVCFSGTWTHLEAGPCEAAR
jgi:hypothetical protein